MKTLFLPSVLGIFVLALSTVAHAQQTLSDEEIDKALDESASATSNTPMSVKIVSSGGYTFIPGQLETVGCQEIVELLAANKPKNQRNGILWNYQGCDSIGPLTKKRCDECAKQNSDAKKAKKVAKRKLLGLGICMRLNPEEVNLWENSPEDEQNTRSSDATNFVQMQGNFSQQNAAKLVDEYANGKCERDFGKDNKAYASMHVTAEQNKFNAEAEESGSDPDGSGYTFAAPYTCDKKNDAIQKRDFYRSKVGAATTKKAENAELEKAWAIKADAAQKDCALSRKAPPKGPAKGALYK